MMKFMIVAIFAFAASVPVNSAIVSPAVVTATSSQIIARNYNGFAAPVAYRQYAPFTPYVAAPAVAAPLKVAAPVVAAPLKVAAPAVVGPVKVAPYVTAPAAPAPLKYVVAPVAAAPAVSTPLKYVSAPVAAPYVAAPLKLSPNVPASASAPYVSAPYYTGNSLVYF